MVIKEKDAARFWEKVDRRGPDECWEWTAFRLPDGYGYAWMGGRKEVAHRVSWEISRGSIPDGLCVLHTCDNRPCVNPGHLWLGTKADNNRDAVSKGRNRHGVSPGTRNGQAKLTEADVIKMRALYISGEWTQQQLGDLFGISRGNVQHIVSKNKWRHV